MLCLKHFSFNLLTSFFVLILFTSYVPNNRFENQKVIGEKLKVVGFFNHNLKGEMSFIESIGISNKGIKYKSLTLKFEGITKNKIAILISKENTGETIREGAYNVIDDSSDAIDHYNGMFGYYNNMEANELPFFTESGNVVITSKTKDIVEGFINLNLKNANNKELTISGKFVAKK